MYYQTLLLLYSVLLHKMVDVCQWRASIGLWNYCQAASSRPTNGYYSYTFKTGSKPGSNTPGEKTSKLPAALSLSACLLLLILPLSSSRHILIIPPTGKQRLQLCTCICIFTGSFIIRKLLPSTMYYWCYCY